MDGNGGGKDGDVRKGVLGVGGMEGKDGARGGSAWVAARSPRFVRPRNRRSRTQGEGRLRELRLQFGNEFAGEVAAEGVEEGRGGGRTGQGRGSKV